MISYTKTAMEGAMSPPLAVATPPSSALPAASPISLFEQRRFSYGLLLTYCALGEPSRLSLLSPLLAEIPRGPSPTALFGQPQSFYALM